MLNKTEEKEIEKYLRSQIRELDIIIEMLSVVLKNCDTMLKILEN